MNPSDLILSSSPNERMKDTHTPFAGKRDETLVRVTKFLCDFNQSLAVNSHPLFSSRYFLRSLFFQDFLFPSMR